MSVEHKSTSVKQTPIRAVYRANSGTSGELLLYLSERIITLEHAIRTKEENARKRRAQQLKLSRARAYRLGLAIGRKRAAQEALELQSRLLASYDSIIEKAHQDCLNLALVCAREVIADQAISNSAALWERVQRGISQLLDSNGLTLFVNPSQMESVQRHCSTTPYHRITRIHPDESVAPGNARIETIAGTIELSWQEHFQQLSQHLLSALNQKLAHNGGQLESTRSTQP